MAKKLVVILGPTASGKSAIAINLAKKFGGEVISADSRQVYRGMDIGTGKVTKKEMLDVPHHLLDVASPKRVFTATQYRILALKAIKKIIKQGKTPIICGGTGFYIQAVVDGIVIPAVKPDWRLRSDLEHFSTEKLFKKLKKFDPERAKIIDKNNRRRLVRALEIVIKTKKPIPSLQKNPLPYPVLIIGVNKKREELKKLISERLQKRLKQGMIVEVEKLRQSGVSWKRLESFGLEYRYISQYLQKKLDYSEMVQRLQKEIEHYAKRQMTWFTRQNFAKQNLGGLKSDRQIRWIKNEKEAERLVKKFL